MIETNWFHDLTTESKEDLDTPCQRLIVFLCVLCGAALLFLAIEARAEVIPVHVIDHHDGVRMKLLPTACVDPVSQMMILQAPPQFHSRFKAISSQWQTKDGWKDYAGCWALIPKDEAGTPDDVFILLFADGEVHQIFKGDLLKKAGPGA